MARASEPSWEEGTRKERRKEVTLSGVSINHLQVNPHKFVKYGAFLQTHLQ